MAEKGAISIGREKMDSRVPGCRSNIDIREMMGEEVQDAGHVSCLSNHRFH